MQALHHNKKIRLIPGQGFSDDAINSMLDLSKTVANASCFDFSLWNKLPKRASKKLTHKHKTENILISEPRQSSENEFLMEILIDEQGEMMRDHQTGLHVQGMLLVEAARQAYLATMEKFYVKNNNEKYYFIFNNLNVEYNRFSFPLPSTIRLITETMNTSNKKRIHTTTRIELLQCNEISASVLMDVSIMPNIRISNMETKLASQSLNEYMNNVIPNYTCKQRLGEAINA
ncbi:hypothetical protein AB835_12185 [Candidatus Endobugula sertula]|uniref:A-factor biosynthesis hotdog domain-containing protein n=1 Tax=Candidatus Endobugula sertula TaxID=62101 RepID=A0A1D2QMK9_9GAMM|nr:hypothetical protein AB835_12185 [Candidatus Endobugula sertula]